MYLWQEGFRDLTLDLFVCSLRLKWLTQVGMCEAAKNHCQHKAWSSLCLDTSLPGKRQHRSSSSSCVVCQDRWGAGQVISWVPEAFVTLRILLQQGCEETQNLTREAASASNFGIDQLNCLLACSLFCLCIGLPIYTWGFLLGHLSLLQHLYLGKQGNCNGKKAPRLDMGQHWGSTLKATPKGIFVANQETQRSIQRVHWEGIRKKQTVQTVTMKQSP